MRRYATALFAIAVLSGCVSLPYSLERPATEPVAALTMRDARPAGAWQHDAGNGINSIDGHAVSVPVGSSLYLREGRHVVGYLCPGWVSVDAGAMLTRDFKANVAYVLDCTDSPNIHEATRSN